MPDSSAVMACDRLTLESIPRSGKWIKSAYGYTKRCGDCYYRPLAPMREYTHENRGRTRSG